MAEADDYKGAPRWVIISATTALVLLLLIVVHFFLGGGMAGIHGAASSG